MNRDNIFFDYLLPIILLVALSVELFYTCNNESTKKEEKQNTVVSQKPSIYKDSVEVFYSTDSTNYTIQIHVGVYNFYSVLVITQDLEYATKALNSLTKKESVNIKELSTLAGITIIDDNANPIIWVNGFDWSPKSHSALAHEISHASFTLMNVIGMQYSEESEEAYSYLIQEFTNKFYIGLYKIQNKNE